MSRLHCRVPRLALLLLAALLAVAPGLASAKKTVCTITVNSADEKDTFRRFLPADQYEFVELVERGRPDWLASACRQGIKCDALIISGHHDNEQGFFSDRVEAGEYLSETELERVGCSNSCPGALLAAEGGLPVRLQYAQPRARAWHVR